MRRKIVESGLFEVSFTHVQLEKSSSRADAHYFHGLTVRAVHCLIQVLFALNQRYLVHEEGALVGCRLLPRRPTDFVDRVEELHGLTAIPEARDRVLRRLAELTREVQGLVE